MKKPHVLSFSQWLVENEKNNPTSKRLFEAEGTESESKGFYGKSKNVTDYALYKYGVFSSEDSITKFSQNLTIKEFVAMDKDGQTYTIKNMLMAYLPTGESIKGLGNVPQAASSISVTKGESEAEDSIADDTELLLTDKNNFSFATIETKITEGLNQHISQLPCSITVNGTTKYSITLGGLIAKLKKAESVKEFRDTASNEEYVKDGKTVFGDLAGNVEANVNSEVFKKAEPKRTEKFAKIEKDPSQAEDYLPTETLVASLPTIKSAVSLAMEKMKGATTPDQAPAKK